MPPNVTKDPTKKVYLSYLFNHNRRFQHITMCPEISRKHPSYHIIHDLHPLPLLQKFNEAHSSMHPSNVWKYPEATLSPGWLDEQNFVKRRPAEGGTTPWLSLRYVEL